MPNVVARLRPAVLRARAAIRRPSNLASALPDHRVLGERIRTRVVARERIVPVTVAGLVLVASVLSVGPVSGVRSSGADAQAVAPRLIAGGGVLGNEPPVLAAAPSLVPGAAADQGAGAADAAFAGGQYLSDGTLLKPVAVDTNVPDASGRLVDYTVKAGDTLTGIAHQFGISMMTIWWANDLTAKDQLHVGQHLVVPPVDGLVVTVKVGDTLDAIATAAGLDPADIADYNGLTDGTVVVGQVLILPGAHGDAIPTPTPKATPKPTPTVKRSSSGSVYRAPASGYSGGKFYWPLPGHSISQPYHYGHYGVDIAGSMGDAVHVAADGVVIYAGWSNLGGGNVVWVSHGSGLYTTYNHMSAILVHTGQHVSKGQVVGRVGMTGWATGPHLHFEVWLGGVPGGVDRRVNPMRYY